MATISENYGCELAWGENLWCAVDAKAHVDVEPAEKPTWEHPGAPPIFALERLEVLGVGWYDDHGDECPPPADASPETIVAKIDPEDVIDVVRGRLPDYAL